jgi:hypothetical protein
MSMLTVADVKDDVKRVLGGADDSVFFSRLNDAVEILATESEWDPLLGQIDVIVGKDGVVTLPAAVGTILAVNVGGRPMQTHDFLFKYHLNGPGDANRKVGGHWIENRPVCVFRDPPSPGSAVCAVSEVLADAGSSFRVYGYDGAGNWIRSIESGIPVDGVLVPVVFTGAIPIFTTQAIRSIVRIEKPVTAGIISLYALSAGNIPQYILGQYLPKDKNPEYRQFQISDCGCGWARIAFRKAVATLSNDSDIIPLHSRYAIILMAKALKKLDEDNIQEAELYQTKAVQLLIKKQLSVDVPSGPSIQMADQNLIADKTDRLDW